MQIDLFDKEMKYDEDKIMEKLLDGKQETYPPPKEQKNRKRATKADL